MAAWARTRGGQLHALAPDPRHQQLPLHRPTTSGPAPPPPTRTLIIKIKNSVLQVPERRDALARSGEPLDQEAPLDLERGGRAGDGLDDLEPAGVLERGQRGRAVGPEVLERGRVRARGAPRPRRRRSRPMPGRARPPRPRRPRAGCRARTASTSAGDTVSPPVRMTSRTRPTMVRYPVLVDFGQVAGAVPTVDERLRRGCGVAEVAVEEQGSARPTARRRRPTRTSVARGRHSAAPGFASDVGVVERGHAPGFGRPVEDADVAPGGRPARWLRGARAVWPRSRCRRSAATPGPPWRRRRRRGQDAPPHGGDGVEAGGAVAGHGRGDGTERRPRGAARRGRGPATAAGRWSTPPCATGGRGTPWARAARGARRGGCAATLTRCESTAPLGRPVLPLVKNTTWGSSSTKRGGRARRCRRRHVPRAARETPGPAGAGVVTGPPRQVLRGGQSGTPSRGRQRLHPARRGRRRRRRARAAPTPATVVASSITRAPRRWGRRPLRSWRARRTAGRGRGWSSSTPPPGRRGRPRGPARARATRLAPRSISAKVERGLARGRPRRGTGAARAALRKMSPMVSSPPTPRPPVSVLGLRVPDLARSRTVILEWENSVLPGPDRSPGQQRAGEERACRE